MKHLQIPPAQDIARIVCPTLPETERRLTEYYMASTGVFNYSLAQNLSPIVFAHSVPLDQALKACEQQRTDIGAKQNAEVLRLIWDAGESRTVRAYDLRPKVFRIRKDIEIKVAPPFYFVEHDQAHVFWLQPRKTHALSDLQLGLLASIIRHTFLVDDFENVGFEVLDLSVFPGTKYRAARTFRLDSLVLVSDSEVHTLLQQFATAFDRVRARGVEHRKRPPKRPPEKPDLFDPK